MISETAMALLTPKHACPGGIWTPGAALRDELKQRLTAEAGILVQRILLSHTSAWIQIFREPSQGTSGPGALR
jgi:hypothetical protein